MRQGRRRASRSRELRERRRDGRSRHVEHARTTSRPRARRRGGQLAGPGDQRIREQVRDHEVESPRSAARRRHPAGGRPARRWRQVRACQGQQRDVDVERDDAPHAEPREPRRARRSPSRRRAPSAPARRRSLLDLLETRRGWSRAGPSNAMPGSITSTSRPGARERPTAVPPASACRREGAMVRAIDRFPVESAGSTPGGDPTSPAAGSISARLASQRSGARRSGAADGGHVGSSVAGSPVQQARSRRAHPGDDRRRPRPRGSSRSRRADARQARAASRATRRRAPRGASIATGPDGVSSPHRDRRRLTARRDPPRQAAATEVIAHRGAAGRRREHVARLPSRRGSWCGHDEARRPAHAGRPSGGDPRLDPRPRPAGVALCVDGRWRRRRADAGSWFGRAFAGTRVPGLDQGVVGGGHPHQRRAEGLRRRRARAPRARRTVERAGALGRVIFSSFDAASLGRLRALSGAADLAVLWAGRSISRAVALAGRVDA